MEPSSDRRTDPVLGEGHYTVVLAGAGHRTLEVTRAGPDFRAGPFIVSDLCGPDNERDYRALAHITAAGDGWLWHRFREDSDLGAALAALVADPSGAAGTYRRAGMEVRRRAQEGDAGWQPLHQPRRDDSPGVGRADPASARERVAGVHPAG